MRTSTLACLASVVAAAAFSCSGSGTHGTGFASSSGGGSGGSGSGGSGSSSSGGVGDFGDDGGPMHYRAWDKNDGALPIWKKDNVTGLVHGPYEYVMAITRRWLAPDGDSHQGFWRRDEVSPTAC